MRNVIALTLAILLTAAVTSDAINPRWHLDLGLAGSQIDGNGSYGIDYGELYVLERETGRPSSYIANFRVDSESGYAWGNRGFTRIDFGAGYRLIPAVDLSVRVGQYLGKSGTKYYNQYRYDSENPVGPSSWTTSMTRRQVSLGTQVFVYRGLFLEGGLSYTYVRFEFDLDLGDLDPARIGIAREIASDYLTIPHAGVGYEYRMQANLTVDAAIRYEWASYEGTGLAFSPFFDDFSLDFSGWDFGVALRWWPGR